MYKSLIEKLALASHTPSSNTLFKILDPPLQFVSSLSIALPTVVCNLQGHFECMCVCSVWGCKCSIPNRMN